MVMDCGPYPELETANHLPVGSSTTRIGSVPSAVIAPAGVIFQPFGKIVPSAAHNRSADDPAATKVASTVTTAAVRKRTIINRDLAAGASRLQGAPNATDADPRRWFRRCLRRAAVAGARPSPRRRRSHARQPRQFLPVHADAPASGH